jgi:hypothetical protein
VTPEFVRRRKARKGMRETRTLALVRVATAVAATLVVRAASPRKVSGEALISGASHVERPTVPAENFVSKRLSDTCCVEHRPEGMKGGCDAEPFGTMLQTGWTQPNERKQTAYALYSRSTRPFLVENKQLVQIDRGVKTSILFSFAMPARDLKNFWGSLLE